MPGGSVNGRPFRESTDSYQRTGIPCGHPRRYRSHDVVRMETGKRTASQSIDGPQEDIQTEGQRHLQTLAKKQIDTNVTLHQQLSERRNFSQGADHRPATADLSGVVTLQEYQTMESTDSYIEEMKGYGITEEEILFKLEAEEQASGQKRSKLSNPEHQTRRLEEVDRKIQMKKLAMEKPDTFSNTKQITRHEMQLEKALSKTSNQRDFLHGVLIKERTFSEDQGDGDPMKSLQEILTKVTSDKHNVIHRLRKSKAKSHDYKSECALECCVPSMSNECSKCSEILCEQHMTVATCMERPDNYVSPGDSKVNKTDNVKKQKEGPQKSTSFTVKMLHKSSGLDSAVLDNSRNNSSSSNCAIGDVSVREIEHVEGIPEHVINRFRLSEEEVKKIPRFENYSPGQPTNVLYVKNLSPKITEADLASLFIRFQKDTCAPIVFKLLTGRMKGQAFVTMPDIETANTALKLVHGYEFKGKPVIIQYGKKNSPP